MEGFPPNFRPKVLSEKETAQRHAMRAQAANPAPDNTANLSVGQVNLQQQAQNQGLMTSAAPIPPTPPQVNENITLSTGDPANIQPLNNQTNVQNGNIMQSQPNNAVNTAVSDATLVAGAVGVAGVAVANEVKTELDNTADMVNNLIIGG